MKQLSTIAIGEITFLFWSSDKSESKRLARLCQTAYDNELTNMVSRSAENQYLLVASQGDRHGVVPIVEFFKTSGMDMVVCINRLEEGDNLYAAYHFETGLRATDNNAPSIESAKRQTRNNIKRYGFEAATALERVRKISNVTNVLIK